RAGIGAHGRRHSRRRAHRGDPGREEDDGREGDGERSARLGGAHPGGAGGRWHHRGAARLPPRSRLRAHRAQAGEAGGRRPENAGPMTPELPLALRKGRVLDEALALFTRAGVDLSSVKDGSRRLIFDVPAEKMRVLVVRDSDVPTYVEYGAADVG